MAQADSHNRSNYWQELNFHACEDRIARLAGGLGSPSLWTSSSFLMTFLDYTEQVEICQSPGFLLIRDDIHQLSLVTIDPEYKSEDKDIKRFLMNLFRRAGKPVEGDMLRFVRIGKKSRAHKLPLATLRGRIEADQAISAEDLPEQLVGMEQ